jgi:hypothetical protein
MRQPPRRVVPEKVLIHPWVMGGYIVNVQYQFASPCTPPSRGEFSVKGTKSHQWIIMRCCKLSSACARSLWGNCKHIVRRTRFSS